ncbi:MAG: protein kinase [Deltaproteobacteria bacterium]|nr:protein kinase [Deltaproteobacteria bacterium]
MSETTQPVVAGAAETAPAASKRVGPYLLIEELATDERASVFLGAIEDLPGQPRKPCVVKLLERPSAADVDATRRLVHGLIGLVHPCIPQVFDAGRFGDRIYLAEEAIVGMTARELVATGAAIPVELAAYVVSEALRGLVAAHTSADSPMLHGRLDLSSVMVSFEGQVKLVGLGSAPEGATEDSDVARMAAVAAELHPELRPSEREARGHATLHAHLARLMGPQAGPAALRELLEKVAPDARARWQARLRKLEHTTIDAPVAPPHEVTAILSEGEREIVGRAAARALRPERIPEGPIPNTRYSIVRPIGEGGMGVVYAAEHVDLGKMVAIKVLHREHAATRDGVARFRDEARAASAIRHPHVVEVTDFGEMQDERLFLVMEYLEGEPLASMLEREGVVDQVRALRIAQDIASGVAEAHRRGVIHRDIKPENIFLTTGAGGTPIAKVLDFGIAKRAAGSLRKTRHGVVCGTPAYMAPEQAAGDPVDARADVYSLGAVLYEMLTGQPPFRGESHVEVLRRKMMEMPPPPSSHLGPGRVHPAVDAVVLHALGTTRAMRQSTMDELNADLRFAARQLEAPPLSEADADVDREIARTWAAAIRPISRRPLTQSPLAISVASAGLVIAVGVGALLLGRAPPPRLVVSDDVTAPDPESRAIPISRRASATRAGAAPASTDPSTQTDAGGAEPPLPTNARALETFLSEGDRAVQRGDLAAAVQSYERATFRAPSSARPWIRLADTLFQLHRYPEAERAARRAVALRGGGAHARLTLGVILMRMSRPEEAQAEWRKVLEKDPNNRLARSYLRAATEKREAPRRR